MHGVERAAFAFHRACEAADVRYAFVGGLAVMAWGQPRATADVDALVDLTRAAVPALVRALVTQGLVVDERDLEDAFNDRSHVTIHDPASGFHVDLRLAVSNEEREEIAHARRVDVGSGAVVVPMPEDVIAFKLLYGSPQDLADARSILIRQARRLDLPRLRALADRLGVRHALDAMAREG